MIGSVGAMVSFEEGSALLAELAGETELCSMPKLRSRGAKPL
jgi:hypothetical protein